MRDSHNTCKLDKTECHFLLFKQLKFINVKKLETLLAGIIVGGFICMLLFAMTSCRTGYGCKGNQSWGKMERRINSPY